MECRTFLIPPPGFSPKVEVAGCYCRMESKILFLRRHPDRPQGDTWGVPAGKLEKGEEARAAIVREVYEEVGFKIDDVNLVEMGKLYIRLPQMDYVFHLFKKQFLTYPVIDLGLAEHLEAKWVTPQEARLLPLIPGGREALQFYEEWTRA